MLTEFTPMPRLSGSLNGVDTPSLSYSTILWWTGVLWPDEKVAPRRVDLPMTLFENLVQSFPMGGCPIDTRGLR